MYKFRNQKTDYYCNFLGKAVFKKGIYKREWFDNPVYAPFETVQLKVPDLKGSKMSKFQILCVTMNQHDFSKIKEMNIHSDVVFANQCGENSYKEYYYESHTAKMVSTNTKGVGINRNIALMYADAEYCMFADDVVYKTDLEEIVTTEFVKHPDADVFIFHLETDDPVRKQKTYKRTRKVMPWEPMPWGAFRIAVKLSSIRKANIWFSCLFGGGCLFPSGEDSMILREAKLKGLSFYVSEKTIGSISFDRSSWFTGRNEKYYFGQGAFCRAMHKRTCYLWLIYYSLRTSNNS